MVNERLREDMEVVLNGVREQLNQIAEIQRQRVELTATATACDGRVEVMVNADGLLIETTFADDAFDSTTKELAEAVTAAVQEAARKVARRADELMAPLIDQRNSLPALADVVAGVPNISDLIPIPPPTPTTPPAATTEAAPRSGRVIKRSLVTETEL